MQRAASRLVLVAAAFVIAVPAAVAQLVNPVTHELWSFQGNTVVRTDLDTLEQQSVSVPASPTLLRIDPIRNRVYVRHQTGALTMVDGQTLATTPLIAGAASGSTELALDPERNRIWAIASDGVRVIDGGDLSSETIPMPDTLWKLAVDPVADRAYTGSYRWPAEEINPIFTLRQLAPEPAALADTIDLVQHSEFLPHRGIAVDPVSGRTVSQLWSGMFGGASLFARTDWPAHTVLVQNGGGADLVIDAPGGRLWAEFAGGGFGSCGSVRAFSLSTLGAIAGTSQTVCSNGLTASPATSRGYATGYEDGNYDEFILYEIDPVAPSITPHPFGLFSWGDLLGLDVATNEVYLDFQGAIVAVPEPVATPVPIVTTITPGTPTSGGSVDVQFAATTGFPLPVRRIYWQVDAIDGEWTAATPAGATGSATITDLSPGAHLIHAFATDGQEATIASGAGQPIVVGQLASVEITVPSVTLCSNGLDDDGDSLADYPADPGCKSAQSGFENPQCDNGLDDDGDLAIDHPADAKCRARWDNDEATNPSCGLGAELVGLLTALSWRRGRGRAARG